MKRAIAITLVVVGCSSSSGGSGNTGTGGTSGACMASPNACHDTCNPCTKLTQTQVAMAVGVAVGPGDNSSNSHQCHFEHDTSSGLPDLQVDFGSNIDAQTFADICAPVSGDASAGIVVTPVSGVGDGACYTSLPGLGGPILNFLRGCWSYSVAVADTTSTDAAIEAEEKAIALDALPNL